MRQLVSKLTAAGALVVAVYLLITTGLIFYSLTCSGIFCGLGIILPVMPWILLLESILPDTIWTYFGIVIVNSVILYYLGRYIGTLITERDHRRELRKI